MSFQGARSGLAIATEITYGTSPATGYSFLPFGTHTLELTKALVEGNDIRPDRMPRWLRHGTRGVQGSVNSQLRKTDYDSLFESLFMGAYATNILKVGNAQKYFSIEDQALDGPLGATKQYRLFKGMAVSAMNISLAPDQPVNARFDFVGRDMTQSSTSVQVAAPADDSDNAPFDSFNGSITEGGAVIATVTALDLTMSNDLSNAFVIGSNIAAEAEYGMMTVTGTITVRYSDAVLINKFLNETTTSLSFEIDDITNANPYTFSLPNIRYTGASVPVSGTKGRLVTLPFTALYDETSNTNISLTRTAP
jgi:hypothetical protein